MRNNQPVTRHEVLFDAESRLVSMTDLQSNIIFVNQAFIQISGYSEQELIGSPHNLVRHPDMPAAAFADFHDAEPKAHHADEADRDVEARLG